MCYEIVFDFSKAVGASYGVFKISVGRLQLLATLILIKKDTKLITKLKIVSGVAYIGFSVAIVVVQSTQLRVYVVSIMLVTTLRTSVHNYCRCMDIFIPLFLERSVRRNK